MAKLNLADRIKQGVFFIDGAMGTELFARGAKAGQCNDALNIDADGRAIVKAVHTSYFAAGCDAVITNTFGANGVALGRHGLADKAVEINIAGAGIARSAAGDDKYVLGDIGPCGDFLEPLGMLKADDLADIFKQQAQGLADGGVDGFIIETMTALEEIEIAINAVKSVSDLPIFASLSYDPAGDEFRTMMGVDTAAAVSRLCSTGITAIGFNCGTLDMAGYVALASVYAAQLADSDILLMAEPNAGKPELIDGKAVYTLPANDFASAAQEIQNAGAKIMGGCCGTSPTYIKAMIDNLCEEGKKGPDTLNCS